MSDLDDRLERLASPALEQPGDAADIWARGRSRRTRRRLLAGSAVLGVLLLVVLAAAVLPDDDNDAVDTITGPEPTDVTEPDPTDEPEATAPTVRVEGDTTPVSTGSVGFELLATSADIGPFPFVRFASDLGSYDKVEAEMSSRFGATIPRSDVDEFDAAGRVIVVFIVPSNGCTPLFAGLDEAEPGVLEPRFVASGRRCEDLLLSHAIVAAVDRDAFAGITTLRLPAQEPYFASSVETSVALSEVFPGITDQFISTTFGTESGSAPLPPVGEAALGADDANTPFVVVHHDDGTVSAIDARTTDSTGTTDGLVRWDAAQRRFFGHRMAFDEYGRRLDGPRSNDLGTHATRVEGGTVFWGDIVRTPLGDPIVEPTDPPGTADIDVSALILLTLDEALAAPIGTVVHVDATMVADGSGARVCKLDREVVTRTFTVECPLDAPEAFDVDLLGEDVTFAGNPILATRVDGGFADIVTIFR